MKIKIIQECIDKIRRKINNRKSLSRRSFPANFKSYQEDDGKKLESLPYYKAYQNHTGYISMKWEHYFHIYNKAVSPFIQVNKPVDLLEIGVQNGGSLQVWQEILPENSKITGIDIDNRCKQLKFNENISLYIGNASDEDFIVANFKDSKFDVIVDDGSHNCNDVIKSFNLLFEKLNYGGIYIIEDCHTSYWKEFIDGGFRKKKSTIEYFKNLVDSLNFLYIDKKDYTKAKDEIDKLKELNKKIASISFYDSVIVIEKYQKEKTTYFRNFITSGEGLIVPKESALKCSVLCDKNTKFEKFFKE